MIGRLGFGLDANEIMPRYPIGKRLIGGEFEMQNPTMPARSFDRRTASVTDQGTHRKHIADVSVDGYRCCFAFFFTLPLLFPLPPAAPGKLAASETGK